MADLCIAPNEIEEGDLLAYLEGHASATVVAHIARCPACAAEVAALRSAATRLIAALDRAACPDLDDLLLYQADMLPCDRRQWLHRHIQDCAHCQQELAQLAVPPNAPTLTPVVERMAQTGRRILTGLLQPAAPALALAFRGHASRQYTYQAGDYQLILAVLPPPVDEDVWQLEGQLIGYDAASFAGTAITVSVQQAGMVVMQDTLDEFGFFAGDRLAAGTYTLQIDLPDTQILIEDFSIP